MLVIFDDYRHLGWRFGPFIWATINLAQVVTARMSKPCDRRPIVIPLVLILKGSDFASRLLSSFSLVQQQSWTRQKLRGLLIDDIELL